MVLLHTAFLSPARWRSGCSTGRSCPPWGSPMLVLLARGHGAALVGHRRPSASAGPPASSACRGRRRSPAGPTGSCAIPTTWRSCAEIARPAAGPHRLAHGAGLQPGERLAAAGAHPGRGGGAGAASPTTMRSSRAGRAWCRGDDERRGESLQGSPRWPGTTWAGRVPLTPRDAAGRGPAARLGPPADPGRRGREPLPRPPRRGGRAGDRDGGRPGRRSCGGSLAR